jgi:hypothetical protein
MGTTYRFIATVDEASSVLEWFRSLSEQPVESAHDAGALFYFRQFGPVDADVKKSPLVNVFMPVRRRRVLTTIGEVHFLPTPLSTYASLNRINKRFREWIMQNPCVYSHRPDFVHEWDYFLEGSAKNCDTDIFALPGGLAALKEGSYFVAADDNEWVLDRVCRTLELRGVDGLSG